MHLQSHINRFYTSLAQNLLPFLSILSLPVASLIHALNVKLVLLPSSLLLPQPPRATLSTLMTPILLPYSPELSPSPLLLVTIKSKPSMLLPHPPALDIPQNVSFWLSCSLVLVLSSPPPSHQLYPSPASLFYFNLSYTVKEINFLRIIEFIICHRRSGSLPLLTSPPMDL